MKITGDIVFLFTVIIITLIFGIKVYVKSWKLAGTAIIKNYVDKLTEDFSKFPRIRTIAIAYIPTTKNIKEIKLELKESYPEKKYSGMTIRQAIHFAYDTKQRETNTKQREARKKASNLIPKIDYMSGQAFEVFLKGFFESQGFKTKLTSYSGDQGVDLILHKGGKIIAVQCKRYNVKNRVGNSAIQEVVTGKLYYDCTECWVITTSYFTNHAINLANKVGVVLIDRNALLKMLNNY